MKKVFLFSRIFLLFLFLPIFADTAPDNSGVTMLYAFTADNLTIKYQSGKKYILTFQKVSRAYTYFSDRPYRITGNDPIHKLAYYWSNGKDSFGKIPPNALIEGFSNNKESSIQETIVFELTNPHYNLEKDSLTFNGILLGNQKLKSADLGLKDPSVFIDGYWNPVYG